MLISGTPVFTTHRSNLQASIGHVDGILVWCVDVTHLMANVH